MNTKLAGGARWPTGTDYARAIQHTKTAFGDKSLQNATLATNTMGMPLVASGQNAVVFLLRASGNDQAIRCFTTPPVDGSTRYDALAAHLANTTATAITASRWLDDGIRVDERRWPVVVMPWVEGRPFNLVVEDLAGDGEGLRRMADAWVAMVEQLQAADVTHGDLQHGNVLVTDEGELCLVDLDGSWVPTMRVGAPDESGHPNYQHPRRGAAQWGRNGDSFSALVVETGLRALAADPSLERCLNGENVLFSRHDLLNTESEIWRRILTSPDLEVVRLATILKDRTMDHPDASMIPFAKLRLGQVAAPTLPSAPSSPTPLSDALPASAGDAWWSSGSMVGSTAASVLSTPVGSSPTSAGASTDHLITSVPIAPGSSRPPSAPPAAAPTASSGRRGGLGSILGRDAAVSGALGGGFAALLGSLIAGLISRGLSVDAVPAVYVSMVALLLGAFLVSWQALTAGAYRAAARRALIGGTLGVSAGLLSLLPATAIYHIARKQTAEVTIGHFVHKVFDIPAALSGLVWMVVAILIGIGVGALRGLKSAVTAAFSGAIAGFAGGCLFGAKVAKFDGHLLLVNGLDPATFVIVTAIGVVIGFAIGATGKTVSRGRLVVIEGRQHGMETLLPAKQGSIGSSSKDTLVLVGNPNVGPRHVELDLTGPRPKLTVPAQRDPIWVNGVETKLAELRDGDVITVGGSFVRFEWKGGDRN